MNRKNSLPAVIAGLLMIFLVSNCKKQESPEPTLGGPNTNNPTVPANPYNPPAVTFTAPVKGFVVNEADQPVQGATVVTGSKTTTTDENGAFEIDNAAFTGNFCYIKAVKSGFFAGSTTIHGKSGNSFTTRLVMLPQNNTTTYKATDAKNITLSGGASLDLPANGIKKLDGSAYTGNVHVAINHLDPSSANFSQVTPGGDLRAYTTDGRDVMLYSYGMMGVELRDDAGNYLQLADGKKATLSMPVPADMKSKAPATIPLWYFDENKGVWIEEGVATLQNGIYTGSVSHFTYWNCDVPGNRAKLRGKLRDCDNELVKNLSILTGQTTAWSDDKGNWERWVPAGVEFTLNACDYTTGLTIKLNIPVPVLADNQEHDMGTITIPCLQKLKATVTDCDGNPFKGYFILKSGAISIRGFVEDGKLDTRVIANGESAELFFYQPAKGQLEKILITLPVKDQSKDLGAIQVCPSNSVTSEFSFDYDDGSGVKSFSFNTDIKEGSGTYYTGQSTLQMFFSTNDKMKAARFSFKNPKVGNNQPDQYDSMAFSSYTDGLYFSFESSNTLIFQVAKYQGPGGEISGTFSGTMKLYNSNTSTQKIATITNGKFTALRLPDE